MKKVLLSVLFLFSGVLNCMAEGIVPAGKCPAKSQFTLPYDQTLDPSTASYLSLDCEIKGSDKYNCGEESLRYISLPNFKNIDVILVPMDCGDFTYRYYLVTVIGKEMVADYYVEGEWYEPGDEEYKELTSFTIDENYLITVTTKSVENGKTSLKDVVQLKILDDGVLSPQN